MARFQVSINVSDVDAAVDFYRSLLGVGPAKHRDGYANFVVEEPPLKLIVIEGEGAPGTINHMGIEHPDGDAVAAETQRIVDVGLPVEVDEPHTCCFATQQKAWTQDPDGVPWEIYTVVADTDRFGSDPRRSTALDTLLPPIGAAELATMVEDGSTLVVDAQGPGGYEHGHIEGALRVDLENAVAQVDAIAADHDATIVVYCSNESCQGSEFVGTLLVQAGYRNVRRFPGGIEQWTSAPQHLSTAE